MVFVVGGAESIRVNDHFVIGKRNIHSAQTTLEKLNLKYKLLDTGGHFSRTVEIKIINGVINIRKKVLHF